MESFQKISMIETDNNHKVTKDNEPLDSNNINNIVDKSNNTHNDKDIDIDIKIEHTEIIENNIFSVDQNNDKEVIIIDKKDNNQSEVVVVVESNNDVDKDKDKEEINEIKDVNNNNNNNIDLENDKESIVKIENSETIDNNNNNSSSNSNSNVDNDKDDKDNKVNNNDDIIEININNESNVDNNNNNETSYNKDIVLKVVDDKDEKKRLYNNIHHQDPIYTVLKQKVLFKLIVSKMKRYAVPYFAPGYKYHNFNCLSVIVDKSRFNLIPYRLKLNHPITVTPSAITSFVRKCKDINIFRLIYKEKREYFLEPHLLYVAIDNGSLEIFRILAKQVYPVKFSRSFNYSLYRSKNKNIIGYARKRSSTRMPYTGIIARSCNLELIGKMFPGYVWNNHQAVSSMLKYQRDNPDRNIDAILDTMIHFAPKNFGNIDKIEVYETAMRNVRESFDTALSLGIVCSTLMIPTPLVLAVFELASRFAIHFDHPPSGHCRWFEEVIKYCDAGIIPYVSNRNTHATYRAIMQFGTVDQLKTFFMLHPNFTRIGLYRGKNNFEMIQFIMAKFPNFRKYGQYSYVSSLKVLDTAGPDVLKYPLKFNYDDPQLIEKVIRMWCVDKVPLHMENTEYMMLNLARRPEYLYLVDMIYTLVPENRYNYLVRLPLRMYSIEFSNAALFNYMVEKQIFAVDTDNLLRIANIGNAQFFEDIKKLLTERQIDILEVKAQHFGSLDFLKTIYKYRKCLVTRLGFGDNSIAEYYYQQNKLSLHFKSLMGTPISLNIDLLEYMMNKMTQEEYDKMLAKFFVNAHKENLDFFNYAIKIGAYLNITEFARSKITYGNDYSRKQLLLQYRPPTLKKNPVGRPKKKIVNTQ
ncbi:hypothetical protein PPL_01650 [Heterostelium album PN500]|uniref:Uncharacterized protein n=1 Tax=Heterostelium pallidum (strain ATCC 26659 / Pp 5 / PN500) TaxID=670386 RepID=D3B036_HETP5|nr:hypothetical protein PPL_01650 [Heterostelium album PN500]EFA84660.1 hypothetical protein PPL_01650 [Heterostelium album PN500]|eukprot:XP_020436773.1 hypothetical protein PPL_01650 [Heterostelium album PN500]